MFSDLRRIVLYVCVFQMKKKLLAAVGIFGVDVPLVQIIINM